MRLCLLFVYLFSFFFLGGKGTAICLKNVTSSFSLFVKN